MTETKAMKVIFNKNGKGNYSTKINLSFIWLKKMGISEDMRDVQVTFDGKRIIIEPAQSSEQETE